MPHRSQTPARRPQAARARWRRFGLLLGLVLFLIQQAAVAAQPENGDSLLPALKDKKVSIRGEGLSASLLLRSIGRKGGVNILVADTVTETMNLEADEMTLYDLFHTILAANGLQYTEKNRMIYVAKTADLKKGEQETTTAQLCPKHGNASEYLDQLTPLLGEHGSLTIAERSNCLVAQGPADAVGRARDMLTRIDLPTPQVHIKASIVSVSKEAKRQLGIKWGYTNYQDDDTLALRTYPMNASADNLLTETGNLVFGILHDNLDLDIELQALQENDLLRILSSPQILVLNGKEAEIKQGKEIPYVAQSGDNLNTSFREANLSLKVTPVVRDDRVSLAIKVNNDSVDQDTSGGEPLINRQEISTNLLLKNNVTVVIGGIILNSEDSQKGEVPGLARIPLLGHLFRSTEKSDSRSELLVFLTPNIIAMEESAALVPTNKAFLDDQTRLRLLPEGHTAVAPQAEGAVAPVAE